MTLLQRSRLATMHAVKKIESLVQVKGGGGESCSLVSRPFDRGESAWYLLHVHALITPRKPGVPQTTVLFSPSSHA